jgi:molybdopterin-containing oxidoreductase family iron-sulfur binding subunit
MNSRSDYDAAAACGQDCACQREAGTDAAAGVDASRRAFLRTVTSAAVAVAPGMMLLSVGASPADARDVSQPVSSRNRWGLLIDAAKFTDADVDACVAACQKENGWHDTGHPLTDAQWIRRVDLHNVKTNERFTLPMMCQHCAAPPCVDVCPTGASFKREDCIVLVDRHICIGCRYCMMACPYKARSFGHEHVEDQKEHAPRGIGCVESCTLCVHRVDAGRVPACVEAAPAGAMVFGDLNDPASEIAQLVKTVATQQVRADLNLDPGIRYRNI